MQQHKKKKKKKNKKKKKKKKKLSIQKIKLTNLQKQETSKK